MAMKRLRVCTERALFLLRYNYHKMVLGHQIRHPPTFIVGCGHSGTSLMLAVLRYHSSIYAIPRETNFAYASNPMAAMKRFDMRTVVAGKSRWVEKTPRHIRCMDRL
ncbi:MAG TPA: hypothetical protein VNZ57_06465 [Longimicrobiales bacterium]|nr:hypothetical protein [Longimicrobiales bacterium]